MKAFEVDFKYYVDKNLFLERIYIDYLSIIDLLYKENPRLSWRYEHQLKELKLTLVFKCATRVLPKN